MSVLFGYAKLATVPVENLLHDDCELNDLPLTKGDHMTLQFEVFRATLSTWNRLFEDASKFATGIGKERLVTITASADGGNGIVAVWYWA